MKPKIPLLLCAALVFSTVALKAEQPLQKPVAPAVEDRTLADVLKADGRYKILLSALSATELKHRFDTGGPYTFFAPTDEAFQRVPKLAELLADEARLSAVLQHHVIENRRLDTAMLYNEAVLTPMRGSSLKVTTSETSVRIDDDAKIVQSNVEMKTGIIHGIDHVLMKENDSVLREAGSTLEAGVKEGAHKVYDGLKTGAEKIKEAVK